MAESNVCVIVVSYNTREKLRRCLECIEAQHEVIVVDNHSTDGTVEMIREHFPLVTLVENDENRGFGPANNQGIHRMTRKLALFLNSDCYADPGSIKRLADAMATPEIVACGGLLKNPDGSRQLSVAKQLTLWAVFLEQTFLESIFRQFGLGYWQTPSMTGPSEVEQVMGACLMCRPVESFDERFFLYCEDTDLCRRLRHHGKILFVPDAPFTHELGSSSLGANRWLSVARYNRGKELYFQIHHGGVASWFCLVLDRFGALLRMLVWAVATVGTLGTIRITREKARLFFRVLTTKIQGPDHAPHTRQ